MFNNFLSPSMGLSYRDVSNDNFKRWPICQRKPEPDEEFVLLECSTGYWIREGGRWELPNNAQIAVMPGDTRDGVGDFVIQLAYAAGQVDIGVPVRYLPDRCRKPSRMFRRVARR